MLPGKEMVEVTKRPVNNTFIFLNQILNLPIRRIVSIWKEKKMTLQLINCMRIEQDSGLPNTPREN